MSLTQIVEDYRLMPGLNQGLSSVASDKSGAACNQYPHRCLSSTWVSM